jgi:hypothetical protein
MTRYRPQKTTALACSAIQTLKPGSSLPAKVPPSLLLANANRLAREGAKDTSHAHPTPSCSSVPTLSVRSTSLAASKPTTGVSARSSVCLFHSLIPIPDTYQTYRRQLLAQPSPRRKESLGDTCQARKGRSQSAIPQLSLQTRPQEKGCLGRCSSWHPIIR